VTTNDTLTKTNLHAEHIRLGAKMVDFGGWEMPVQYEGILAEYSATRNAATLFDISHMGEFIIEGDCVQTGLDRIVTMNLTHIPIKACRYGALLNEQGGVIDDLIVFRIAQEKWFLVVNAATTLNDAEHLRKQLKQGTVFQDVSMQTGKLDIQGPQARKILSVFVEDIKKLDYYTFDYFKLFGETVLVSRTGYTGELGYEIYTPWNKTKDFFLELLKSKKVKPAGLGARDILRLEMGYSLYGHELTEEITALESGLKRFIDFEKDFIGKDALLQQKQHGLERKVVGFVSSNRRAPRAGQKMFSDSIKEIGLCTSGTFSPCLNKGIGLALVNIEHSEVDQDIFFCDNKKQHPAKISKKNFYKNGSLKN